jgi:hypothetical protein
MKKKPSRKGTDRSPNEKNLGKFRRADTNGENAPRGAHAIPSQTAISHQADDQLELYALGRLTEPEQAALEEHLLICEACRQRLEEAEAFAKAMRRAIADSPTIE